VQADNSGSSPTRDHFEGAARLHAETGQLAFSRGILRDLDGDGNADFLLKIEGVAVLSADDLIL
jgi:hypothetical protein